MVSVLQPPVKVGDTVITLVPEVEVVGVVDEAGAEGERQVGLKEADHGINKSGRDSDAYPFGHHHGEHGNILPHDVLHDPPFQLSHVDGEEGPTDEGDSVEGKKDG